MSLWEGLGLGLGLGLEVELEAGVKSTLTSRSSRSTSLRRTPLATALVTAWARLLWRLSRPREIVPRSYQDARL